MFMYSKTRCLYTQHQKFKWCAEMNFLEQDERFKLRNHIQENHKHVLYIISYFYMSLCACILIPFYQALIE